METLTLPSWLEENLPEAVPPHRLGLTEDKQFKITAPDGSVEVFADIEQAATAVHGCNLNIDDDVADAVPGNDGPRDMGIFYPVSKHYSGWLVSYDDSHRRDSLVRAYKTSLKAAKKYAANPNDFYAAYHFVDTHPAFWTCSSLENHPWYWVTEGHCGRVSQYVYAEKGTVTIALETGQHVDTTEGMGGKEGYTSHYHDYRLDVFASTFEEAFIKLAALVDKFYNTDGTEKPDVAHEKPDWVVELEERISEYKDSKDD